MYITTVYNQQTLWTVKKDQGSIVELDRWTLGTALTLDSKRYFEPELQRITRATISKDGKYLILDGLDKENNWRFNFLAIDTNRTWPLNVPNGWRIDAYKFQGDNVLELLERNSSLQYGEALSTNYGRHTNLARTFSNLSLADRDFPYIPAAQKAFKDFMQSDIILNPASGESGGEFLDNTFGMNGGEFRATVDAVTQDTLISYWYEGIGNGYHYLRKFGKDQKVTFSTVAGPMQLRIFGPLSLVVTADNKLNVFSEDGKILFTTKADLVVDGSE